MRYAYPMQKFQDWVTQQWVILWGRRINPAEHPWLMGPFGNLDVLGSDFIQRFAEKEGLLIDKTTKPQGLIPSMQKLSLTESEGLSRQIVDFYELTTNYDIDLFVKWNPFFQIFGRLINILFSHRIGQLNVPIKDVAEGESVTSEISTLIDPSSNQTKYTFWHRSIKSSGQVVYSGAYGVCQLPSGEKCIKAVFPLPNGNATVVLSPSVGENGELVLESSGKKFGDPGFYFLLKDGQGDYWTQFIRSFRDRLTIREESDYLWAEQTLTLFRLRVVRFAYRISAKQR